MGRSQRAVDLWLYFEANEIFCGISYKVIRQRMVEFPYTELTTASRAGSHWGFGSLGGGGMLSVRE